MSRPGPKAARWAVPASAFAAIVAAAALSGPLSTADAEVPDLPALTPAEVLVKAQTADVTALSGTVRLTNALGLPDLGGLGDGSGDSLAALLAGSHDAHIAFDGPERARVALPTTLAETSWILGDDEMWSWDSESQRVLHARVPDHSDARHHGAAQTEGHSSGVGADPAAFAQRFLDDVSPTTELEVRSPRYVAGRAAYELALDPRSETSTVSEVTIAVDAETGLPLDVAVTAAGATEPVFELGFTEVTLAAPPPETFAFTPPPDATVVEADDPAALAAPGTPDHHRRHRRDGAAPPTPPPNAPAPQVSVVGEAWDSVAVVTGAALAPQVTKLFDAAPQVSTGTLSGRLVSTKVVNVVRLDDGRIALGAVHPDALMAALAASG